MTNQGPVNYDSLQAQLAAVTKERDQYREGHTRACTEWADEVERLGKQVSDLQLENNRLDRELEIAKNERHGETHRANTAMAKYANLQRQLSNNNKVSDGRISEYETKVSVLCAERDALVKESNAADVIVDRLIKKKILLRIKLSALRMKHDADVEDALRWGRSCIINAKRPVQSDSANMLTDEYWPAILDAYRAHVAERKVETAKPKHKPWCLVGKAYGAGSAIRDGKLVDACTCERRKGEQRKGLEWLRGDSYGIYTRVNSWIIADNRRKAERRSGE